MMEKKWNEIGKERNVTDKCKVSINSLYFVPSAHHPFSRLKENRQMANNTKSQLNHNYNFML